jgi:hypothetical protein
MTHHDGGAKGRELDQRRRLERGDAEIEVTRATSQMIDQ